MPPNKLILGIAVGASLLLHRVAPTYTVRHSYAWTAVVLALVQYVAWMTWRAILYPKLFSPLRRLPQPPGATFLNGHAGIILKRASGEPMREWVDTVPNDGLIYYRNWANMERVLLTNPKTLAEVLSVKNYEFIKPGHFREGLARILGVGILLAEGDEHKRQRKALMPAFAFRHIKELYPVFWSKSREMVERLREASKSPVPTSEIKNAPGQDPEKSAADATVHAPGAVEVGKWSSRATLDIIGQAGMGLSLIHI